MQQTLTASTTTKPAQSGATSRRIAELASNLDSRLADSVGRFTRLNVETRFVALNARIEAGRAGGESGRAFDVVAQAIQDISHRTGDVAENLSGEFRDLLKDMREITHELATDSRGQRLSDLALTNIDLIDRNLYERSCDVRWWATDPSIVDALVNPTPQALSHASKRMGQILDSYTVYFDIAVVDLNGRVLANGRPSMFRSVDSVHTDQSWFARAMRTADGTEYVQSDVGNMSLCSDERTIIFACTVRTGGQANGRPLGVLAIVFRWDALAQIIVERTPLSVEEWQRSRVCIVDAQGHLLADSAMSFGDRLKIPGWNEILDSDRAYRMATIDNIPHCIGHARSPGYETYRTGWYSVLMQNDDGA